MKGRSKPGASMHSIDPLAFRAAASYADKLVQYNARPKKGRGSAVYGTATIDGQAVVLGVTEFKFAGGSMGAVFGERLAARAQWKKPATGRRGACHFTTPVVVAPAVQEVRVKPPQVSKTVAALNRFRNVGCRSSLS